MKIIFTILIIVLILIISLIINYKKRISAERKIDILKNKYSEFQEQYKYVSDNNKKLKHIRHDLAKHIAVTEEMIDKSQNEAYLYDTVNIIVSQKKEKSEKNGISFETNINSIGIYISEQDIISLFSNLLDNAIEACIKVDKKDNPKVKLMIEDKYIRVSNNKLSTEKVNPDSFMTTKKDKANHGYGMQIIKNIVEKYNGTIDINDYEDKLEITIRFL